MKTVLICDDRAQARAGLSLVMSHVPGVQNVDSVAYSELVQRYFHHLADVVLVGTPRGIAAGVDITRRLMAGRPRAHVIVFGSLHDTHTIAAAIAVGARGFLRWDTSRPATIITTVLARQPVGPAHNPTGSDEHARLTERELQVLQGMTRGNSKIGRELHLSEDTIKTHAHRLFHKLGVRDRAQVVAQGFRLRLVS